MRRRSILWFALLLFAVPARAADVDDVSSDALQPGRNALQFQIDDGFSVSGFESTTLSFKRMVSERSAWRVGVTYDGSTFDGDFNRQAVIDTSLVPDESLTDSDQGFNVSLSAIYMRYVGGRSRVRPFLGFGPFGGYSHSESHTEGVYFAPFEVQTQDSQEFSSWQFGARGLFGAEVFVSKGVSILGQFSTSISHVSQDRTFSRVDTAAEIPPDAVRGFYDERTSDGWNFGQNRVSLGLSAYF